MYKYMWSYHTRLSGDISPLRSMYVLGSDHSVAAEGLTTVYFQLNYLLGQRQIYTSTGLVFRRYTCHKHGVAVTLYTTPGRVPSVPSYLFSPIRLGTQVVYTAHSGR